MCLPESERTAVLTEALTRVLRELQTEPLSRLKPLVPHLPEPERLAMAAEVLRSRDLDTYGDTLAAIFPHLPSSLIPEALSRAETLQSVAARAGILRAVAPRLTGVLASRALKMVAKKAFRTFPITIATVAACVTGAERQRALALALSAVEQSDDAEGRATALLLLLPLVQEGERECLRQRAIDAARDTTSPEILAALMQELSVAERPRIIAAALEAAQARSGARRAEALVAIAPHTPEPQRTALFTEAVSVCLDIVDYDGMADPHGRVLALAKLAATLPAPIAVRALDAVIAMAHVISRNLSLYALASFAPTLAQLEGVEGVRTVVRAVRETAAWFP